MKNLVDVLETVNNKSDFIDFINLLKNDFILNQADWENQNIKDFLDAMGNWVEDMEGFYENQDKELPKNIPWNVFSNILYASKIYE